MINLAAVVFIGSVLGGAASAGPEASECHPRGGLPNAFRKLQRGGSVRIAYLGGSITAQPGWRVKTFRWLSERYPQSELTEINAAIGGTGSDLGVFRLRHDVLEHRPDLLFVEFAVNDGGTPVGRIHRAMEGIVRQTWRLNPSTDICFVYTLTEGMLGDLQAGSYPSAARAMETLADHYAIPSVHMGLRVAQMVGDGNLVFTGPQPRTKEGLPVFAPDGVHPFVDTGHGLYLEAVVRAMTPIAKAGEPGPHALGEPLVADNWEDARMIPLSRLDRGPGWVRLEPEQSELARAFCGRLPELWYAAEPGEALRFRFEGRRAAIYDLLGPGCGQVTVRVDDRPPRVVPRFDAFCTYYRLATLTVADDLPGGMHEVSLQVHPEQPDKTAILARRGETIDDPERYDGTAWYAGALLLLGQLRD